MAGGLLLTSAVRYGMTRCLLRTVGVTDRLLSKRWDDARCLELVGLEYLSCSVKFFDQKQLALHLLGLQLQWSVPHTRPEPHCVPAVVKISASLDCVSVTHHLGSAVIPGTASFTPPKTAYCPRMASAVLQVSVRRLVLLGWWWLDRCVRVLFAAWAVFCRYSLTMGF